MTKQAQRKRVERGDRNVVDAVLMVSLTVFAKPISKGRAVCASELHLPAGETEREILDRVERELLNANVSAEVLDIAVQRLTREAPERVALRAECERLDRELGNLALAVAAGGDVPTIVAEIRKRETRKTESERCSPGSLLIETGSGERSEWKRLLRARPTHGQTVLRKLLDGPILVCAPEGDAVPVEAQPNPWGVFGGILSTK